MEDKKNKTSLVAFIKKKFTPMEDPQDKDLDERTLSVEGFVPKNIYLTGNFSTPLQTIVLLCVPFLYLMAPFLLQLWFWFDCYLRQTFDISDVISCTSASLTIFTYYILNSVSVVWILFFFFSMKMKLVSKRTSQYNIIKYVVKGIAEIPRAKSRPKKEMISKHYRDLDWTVLHSEEDEEHEEKKEKDKKQKEMMLLHLVTTDLRACLYNQGVKYLRIQKEKVDKFNIEHGPVIERYVWPGGDYLNILNDHYKGSIWAVESKNSKALDNDYDVMDPPDTTRIKMVEPGEEKEAYKPTTSKKAE